MILDSQGLEDKNETKHREPRFRLPRVNGRLCVSWYGSNLTVFEVSVAPSVPGFSPSDVVTGKSLAEMNQVFESQCDQAFASHICAEHPRAYQHKTLIVLSQT